MNEFENNAYFWQKLDAAYLSGEYKVVYKKGTPHAQYPDLVFPCDYGHVNSSGEGDISLKVFKGSRPASVDALVVCANLLERDLNPIVLIGVTEEEKENILKFLNSNEFQKTVLLSRGKTVPSWAITE